MLCFTCTSVPLWLLLLTLSGAPLTLLQWRFRKATNRSIKEESSNSPERQPAMQKHKETCSRRSNWKRTHKIIGRTQKAHQPSQKAHRPGPPKQPKHKRSIQYPQPGSGPTEKISLHHLGFNLAANCDQEFDLLTGGRTEIGVKYIFWSSLECNRC